jgi:hypothetical protein
MHLSVRRKLRRLPKCFPVGTTYVVEGQVVEGYGDEDDGGEAGRLQVFSRYVVLPSGRRINLGANLGSGALRSRRSQNRNQGTRQSPAKQGPAKRRPAGSKKIMARGGTSQRDRR